MTNYRIAIFGPLERRQRGDRSRAHRLRRRAGGTSHRADVVSADGRVTASSMFFRACDAKTCQVFSTLTDGVYARTEFGSLATP